LVGGNYTDQTGRCQEPGGPPGRSWQRFDSVPTAESGPEPDTGAGLSVQIKGMHQKSLGWKG